MPAPRCGSSTRHARRSSPPANGPPRMIELSCSDRFTPLRRGWPHRLASRGAECAAGGGFHGIPVFTEPKLAESQDVTLLQRRARRRLVGAIALVVLVVVALPIVLDKEPSPIGQDLVIQIPSQDAGKFNTRVLPPSAPG